MPLNICSGESPCNATSWVLLFVQVALGIVLVFYGSCMGKAVCKGKDEGIVPKVDIGSIKIIKEAPCDIKYEDGDGNGRGHGIEQMALHIQKTAAAAHDMIKGKIQCGTPSGEKRINFETALRKQPIFLHIRTEDNFIKSNADESLIHPPAYPAERWVSKLDRMTLYRYLLFSDRLNDMLQTSFGLAMLSGAAGTLIRLILEHERWKVNETETSTVDATAFDRTIVDASNMVEDLIDVFKFFPIFLLIGYLKYSIVRWSDFIGLGYSIQGRINDIGLLVGGALLNPNSLESRQLAFKVYRHLNLAHLINYKAKSVWLSQLTEEDLVTLGLLTVEELKILTAVKIKKRETVLSWLSDEIQHGIENGLLNPSCSEQALKNVAACRGKMGAFQVPIIMSRKALSISSRPTVIDCHA